MKENDRRNWRDIYSEIMDILYVEEEDARQITAGSGGPAGRDGAWIIMENLTDPDALYIKVEVFRGNVNIDALNITQEKFQKITKFCETLDAREEE